MEVVRGFGDVSLAPAGSVVSIGNFDGVHRGHQAVIGSAVEAARTTGLASVVCTFDPHTRVFLQPDKPPRLLETLEQRIRAIEGLGVDITVIVPFSHEVAEQPREDFVQHFLDGALHAIELHVSKDFTFGAGGQGNVDFLRSIAADHQFELHVVAAVVADGRPISSTRIRDAIAGGYMEEATELLGRPFAVTGEVVAGAGRGSDLHAPTANLACGDRFLPGRGVYVTEVRVDGEVLAAVTNVGVRPTFGDDGPLTVETHVLGKQLPLYGQCMELAFLKRLRGEIQFDGPQALAAQIRRDVEDAARYFAESS
jgi:riboflavin kinase/FMN adenylyltransferase